MESARQRNRRSTPDEVGINPRTGKEYIDLYQDPRWLPLREVVLHRDNYRCRSCGSRYNVEVDHIVEVAEGGALFDEANLQALCRGCNMRKMIVKREDRKRGFSVDFDLETGRFTDPKHPSNRGSSVADLVEVVA